MPEKKTIERAKRDARQGKPPTTQAGEFVREEMEHVRRGKHGSKSREQTIAIGLSKARRAGIDLPPPKGAEKGTTKRGAAKKGAAKKGAAKKGAAKRGAAKKSAAKRAPAKRAPAKKRTAKKAAPKKGAAKRRSSSRKAG